MDCLEAIMQEINGDAVEIYKNMSEQEKVTINKLLISIYNQGWSLDYLIHKEIEKEKRRKL